MKYVFTDTGSTLGGIIKANQKCDFNHMGIVLGSGEVIESTWSAGVRSRRLDSMLRDSKKSFIADVRLPKELDAEQFYFSQIGKPYDKSWLLGFGFGRDWQEDDAWGCSELAMTGWKYGGLPLIGDYTWVGIKIALEVCATVSLSQHCTIG